MESMALFVSMNMLLVRLPNPITPLSLWQARQSQQATGKRTRPRASRRTTWFNASQDANYTRVSGRTDRLTLGMKEKRMIWKIFHPQVQRCCLWVQPLWGGPSDCSWGRICRGIRKRLSHSLEWWKVIDVQDWQIKISRMILKSKEWIKKYFGK